MLRPRPRRCQSRTPFLPPLPSVYPAACTSVASLRLRVFVRTHECARACVRAFVHACVRARARAFVRACVHACVRACVRSSVRACARACVRVSKRERMRACHLADGAEQFYEWGDVLDDDGKIVHRRLAPG